MIGSGGGSGIGGGSNVFNGKSNGTVVGSIPQASKKMVQSLKEIVNCPEHEIYAMLKECNMDPNETVNRLLSQDPFHQVKSKREKKKENKDSTDSRSRGGSNTLNRGGRGGNDRYSRGFVSHSAASESGPLRSKPSYKKDNGTTFPSSSSGPGNQTAPAVSETPMESKASSINISEGGSSLRPSSGFQSPWSAVPGHMSMADIVKMGRPHGKGSSNVNLSQQNVTQHFVASEYAPTPHELRSSQNYAAKFSEVNVDLGRVASQNVTPNDEWSQVEQPPAVSVPTILEPPVVSEPYKDPSGLPFDKTDCHLDEVRYAEDAEADSGRAKVQEESSGSASGFNDKSYDNSNSYQVHQHAYEQQEVEDVGVSVLSVATNVQQLSLSKEEEGEEEEEEEEEDEEEEEEEEEEASSQEIDSPAVKIPDHLQVQAADCSHLSFGSFGSGMSGPFSGRSKSNVDETRTAADAPSVGNTDGRNSDYYDAEHLRTATDGNVDHRLAVSSGSYEIPSSSHSEMLKQQAPDVVVAPGIEYSNPSSSNHAFENNQHLSSSFGHSEISSQMQNLSPLPGIMSYSNSLPSSLLPSNVHPVRDAEPSYSPFPITQSMPTKYSSNVALINGPTISMTEDLTTGNLSTPQLTQNVPGSSISGGPAFPQHLPVHPYPQPSLPFANMIGYPFLPQSYTYMPSAFQQAIAAAGNNTYHQSLSAAVLPQYKNSVSVSSLPQSPTVPSGYGAFGSSTSIPGNFSLNPPPADPSATSISYDDVLSSQYKDAAHLLTLQQGPGSRTMSAVPASTYYNFQGQSQQPAGYRQSQQPAQHFGNLSGYPNFYLSQNGMLLEHQQQMSRDGSVGGSQGQQQPKQPQQIWQNSY